MYIVQYRKNHDDRWIFTSREFPLGERVRAINSVKGARNSFPDSEWRLVWVDINVITEDL